MYIEDIEELNFKSKVSIFYSFDQNLRLKRRVKKNQDDDTNMVQMKGEGKSRKGI